MGRRGCAGSGAVSMDLLQELEALDVAPAIEIHALVPNMATACGLCTMWDCKACTARVAHTTDRGWDFPGPNVTCPDCLIVELAAMARRMSGNQARAAA